MTKVTQLSLGEDGGLGRRRIHLREISGDSETPLETVGQDLRAARLRRGDDIATVSRALKIRKDHLAAVEEDDLDSLPGKTYAIGFVRSYATYLGLDAARMVERFKQEISGRHDDHAPAAPILPDEEGRRLPQGWRIVAGVVVLAVGWGAWHLLSAGSEPQPVPPAPIINPVHAAPRPIPTPVAQTQAVPPPALMAIPQDAKPAATATATPPASPAATPAKPVTPATTASTVAPAPAAKPPASNVAASATSGAALPTPSSGSVVTPSGAAVPAVPAPSASSTQVFGAQNKNARVVLKARADTHIVVRGQDGMVYINKTLKAGEAYRVPNIVGLSLSSTNAGAVEMDLDGLSMGRAGTEQETAGDIKLDPQAIVDRYNNH